MIDGSFRKVSLDAVAALTSIPTDVWVWGLAPALVPLELLTLRALSNEWRAVIGHDDVWLPKLTALALQYPALSHLEQASGESAFDWFWRCSRAVGAGDALALRHKRGEFPYLQLYGTVVNNLFTPHAEMRFPVEQGVIAELVDLMARSGKYADPAYDATGSFVGTPEGIALDGSFRKIHAMIKEKTWNVKEDNLKDLPEILAKLYAPRRAPAGGGTSVAPPPATEPTVHVMRRGGAPKLMLRLRRMSCSAPTSESRSSRRRTPRSAPRTPSCAPRTPSCAPRTGASPASSASSRTSCRRCRGGGRWRSMKQRLSRSSWSASAGIAPRWRGNWTLCDRRARSDAASADGGRAAVREGAGGARPGARARGCCT